MRLAALALLLCLLIAPALAQVALVEDRGRTDSGAWYVIQVPTGWQPGDGLVLVNHGFDFRPPGGTPSLGPQVLRQRQLAQGYALAASSYSDQGWALFSTRADHAQLLTRFRERFGEPGRIIASGGSLGGLVALQQAAQPELGAVEGVYALCTPAAGSRVWDQAFDLRLTYDAVCADVSGGRLPRGGDGLPYALDQADLDDYDSWLDGGRIYLAINRCTGIDLPPWAISSGMERRLAQILAVSGVSEEFFLDNMAYATFGLSDLLRSPLKLAGAAALDNRFVDYGDGQINQDIERVQADRLAALELKLNHTPRGDLRAARVLSTHTSGDGLVAPAHQQALQALLPNDQLSVAYVKEAEASHCGYSDAELVAGWEELRDWLDDAPQPTTGSLQARCLGLVAGGSASGECRYDASVQPAPLDSHLRPRQLPAFPLQPASTGLWFDPATPGDGYVIEALADGRAVVARFSYPAAGEGGDQAWFFGTGEIVDEAIVIDQMLRPVGGRFGAAFDPAAVQRQPWGAQRWVFPACGSGETGWQAVAPYGRGRQPLQQLTWLGSLGCSDDGLVGSVSGTPAYSGAWFDPARSGEGGFLHLQADGRAFLLWFSFRPDGAQAWFYGEAGWDASGATFTDVLRPVGARFGAAFDPAAVRFERWGSVRIDFLPQDRIRLGYSADDTAWGSGELDWVRLTQPRLP
jgi:hypothetical protein